MSSRVPKKAATLIDMVDEFLARGDEESKCFWDIMTATRGYDNHKESSFKINTVDIRERAFPKTASVINPWVLEASFKTEAIQSN